MEGQAPSTVPMLPGTKELLRLSERSRQGFDRRWTRWPFYALTVAISVVIAIGVTVRLSGASASYKPLLQILLVAMFAIGIVWFVTALAQAAWPIWKHQFPFGEVDDPAGDGDSFVESLTIYPVNQIALRRRNIAHYKALTEAGEKSILLLAASLTVGLYLIPKEVMFGFYSSWTACIPAIILGGILGCATRYEIWSRLVTLDRNLAEAEQLIARRKSRKPRARS